MTRTGAIAIVAAGALLLAGCRNPSSDSAPTENAAATMDGDIAPEMANDNMTAGTASSDTGRPASSGAAGDEASDAARPDPETGAGLDAASATGMTSRVPRGMSGSTAGSTAGRAADPAERPVTASPPQPWCETLGEAASAARCEEAQIFARNLKAGQGGMSVPGRVYVGDTVEVSFAIVAPPSVAPTPVATLSVDDVLGGKPSAQGKVRASRYMAAVLEGANFTIAPAARQQKDLGVTGAQRWTWQVTARNGAAHALTLSVYAVMPGADGKPTDSLIQVLSQPVQVEVRWLPAVTQGIADATGLTGGTAKLLTALGGLIGAAGGVWAAFRAFGRKPPAA